MSFIYHQHFEKILKLRCPHVDEVILIPAIRCANINYYMYIIMCINIAIQSVQYLCLYSVAQKSIESMTMVIISSLVDVITADSNASLIQKVHNT